MYVKYAMSMWTIGFIWLKMWISGELLWKRGKIMWHEEAYVRQSLRTEINVFRRSPA
jgi:hypothetical protein